MKGERAAVVLNIEDLVDVSSLVDAYSTADVDSWFEEQISNWPHKNVVLPGNGDFDVFLAVDDVAELPTIIISARINRIEDLLEISMNSATIRKIKSLLRQSSAAEAKLESYCGIGIDKDSFSARVNHRSLDLTRSEFQLLAALIAKPGRVFSRDQLISKMYTDERDVSDRAVDVHIKNLRQKLRAACGDATFIHTVYGVGYKLE